MYKDSVDFGLWDGKNTVSEIKAIIMLSHCVMLLHRRPLWMIMMNKHPLLFSYYLLKFPCV
jgi:hypothetical protein